MTFSVPKGLCLPAKQLADNGNRICMAKRISLHPSQQFSIDLQQIRTMTGHKQTEPAVEYCFVNGSQKPLGQQPVSMNQINFFLTNRSHQRKKFQGEEKRQPEQQESIPFQSGKNSAGRAGQTDAADSLSKTQNLHAIPIFAMVNTRQSRCQHHHIKMSGKCFRQIFNEDPGYPITRTRKRRSENQNTFFYGHNLNPHNDLSPSGRN